MKPICNQFKTCGVLGWGVALLIAGGHYSFGQDTAAPPLPVIKAAQPDDIKLAPMVWLSEAERARLHQIVQSDKEAQQLFAPIRQRADAALLVAPSPVKEVIYEGRIESDPQRGVTKIALYDMERLRDLIYAHAATRDARYAGKAREFVLAWVQTTKATGNPINMNKLDAIPAAFAQLRESFNAEEQKQVEVWLRGLADATMRETRNNKGNWHSKRLKLVGSTGFLFDDAKYIEWAATGYKQYVKDNIFSNGETLDLRQRDAMSYHIGGVVPLLEIAIAARASNLDWYRLATPEGASARLAVDYAVPFAKGEKVHAEWVNSKEPFDRKRYESGDQHFKPGIAWEPKDGLKMFELAAFFDADLLPVVARLAESNSPKYGTWVGVLGAATKPKSSAVN